ncbi:hypothetical protein ASD18_04770 [Cellulomonas sp. Root137]|nr:hypothetical protein ASD18_04770 [Cellulomonas sp. Root137]
MQLDQVEGLAAELRSANVEVVVPEVVLWEWAQHAHADLVAHYDSLRVGAKTFRGSRMAGAFPDVSDRAELHTVSVEQVLSHLRDQLSQLDNVSVLPATPAAALVGLKAQVLMQGPGERKSGIKTGAADMAWVQDVLALAESEPARLVLLTSDSDVEAAFKYLGAAPPVRYTRRNQLVGAVRGLVPAPPGDMALSIARYIGSKLPAAIGSVARAGELDELVGTLDDASVEQLLPSRLILGASITEITGLASVRDLQTSRPSDGPVGSLVTASLTLLATISAVTWDPTPDDQERVAAREFEDVALEVPISGRLMELEVQRLRAAAPASVLEHLPLYDSIADGKNALSNALGAVPGLPRDEWWNDVLNDFVPSEIPEGIDWTRNDLMDEEERWEIGLHIHGKESSVIIEADPYEFSRMKRSRIYSVFGTFAGREVNGPTAVAGAVLRDFLVP